MRSPGARTTGSWATPTPSGTARSTRPWPTGRRRVPARQGEQRSARGRWSRGDLRRVRGPAPARRGRDGAADTTRLSREHRLFSPAARADRDRRRQVHDLSRDGPRRRRCGRAGPRVDGSVDDRPAAAPGRGDAAGRAPTRSGCATAAARRRCWGSPRRDPELAAPLPGAGRYVTAEAVHAVTHQGALDLDDILARRTRVSIEAPTAAARPPRSIAPLVAPAPGVVRRARRGRDRPLRQAARRRGGRRGRAGRRRRRGRLPGRHGRLGPRAGPVGEPQQPALGEALRSQLADVDRRRPAGHLGGHDLAHRRGRA